MIERHHIIFKSQGGLDFELNYIYLTSEEHRGNNGPHLNKQIDRSYKRIMQAKLENILTHKTYTIEELIEILELKPKQAYKAFKKLNTVKGIKREDAIFRLMGNSFYL